MTTGQWVFLLALGLALSFGAYRALTDGRFRGTHRLRVGDSAPVEPLGAHAWAHVTGALGREPALGDRATLLQFSSAFCAPCRATRRVLADVAATVPGVTHVEIDAEHHLDLVRRLGVLRTPTTLILDETGREVTRAAGAPHRAQVLSAVAGA